ncbi:methyltransferase domain-containing protein [Natronosporangium hydrolyticum]|uniref:Methyltransferase domain-containing protein n=1 Tax=Natronosporangium hydrolyticum TaxID=2811111 RepID=A0A895YD72_9ACTN|nr:class I SAM-dependent methyltransferase [Natronosporangium hydrolyticum]QSB13403.1 methyltransferase domain-containing protein [Natronosporangium hydrolyticum]
MTEAIGTAPDDYDATHTALHDGALMRLLYAEGMGDQYPAEVEPFSSCTWWLLGQLVSTLRLQPDDLLVDLGCGRGGPGLWLARALSLRLIGVDFSPAAVELAKRRVAAFVPPGRAEFRVATFDQTGLPDGSAAGVVSIDALPIAEDRPAALREVHRILAAGGRCALTVRSRPGVVGKDWQAMALAAGLVVEDALPNPYHDQHWQRLYAIWLANADELRSELGDRAADNLLAEARAGQRRRWDGLPPPLLLVLRRPE